MNVTVTTINRLTRAYFPRLSHILLLAAIALTCLQAQDITKGSVAGVVKDSSGAVIPAANVKLSTPTGDRTTTTNAGGDYSFLNLNPGPGYKVTAEKTGFAPASVDNLSIGINQQVTQDLTLAVGTTATTVNITEATSAIDLSTTTIGANINEDLYRNVPVGRNISAVMAMSPGVKDSGLAGAGNPSINGASGLENEYIINGADTTDPGFGGFGTYSRNYGSLGNGINFDFVQEVQVQTGGFEAQYGEALGGVVNVVTKSGTNDFHADVYGYLQPLQFEAERNNPLPVVTAYKRDYLQHQATLDYGADAGGRILKDKLFFYGGINPLRNTTYERADVSYNNYALGVIPLKRFALDYTGKVNWNIGAKHQLEGSVFGDPSHTPIQYQGNIATTKAVGGAYVPDTSTESKLAYGTRTTTGRYNGTLTPNWVLTVNYSYYYNNLTETPLHNGYEIIDQTTPTQFTYGGVGALEATISKVNQMSAASTHVFRFLGSHTLSYGYQFTDDKYSDIQDYTGAPFVLPNVKELGPAAGQTVYGAEFIREHENPNDPNSPIVLNFTRGLYSSPFINTDTRYQAGFVQDAWSFGKWTLKPGLRFEEQGIYGTQSHYVFSHNWAPRIGVIYDLFANHKTKLDASFGQFYEKIPLDIAVRALSYQLSITGALYQDPGPGNQPNLSASNYIPGGSIAFQGDPSLLENVAAGTRAQLQNEVTAGIEHEFAHNLTVTGRFVYRDLRRAIEDMSGINVTQALNGVPQLYVVGNPNKGLDIFQNVTACTSGPKCNTSTGYTNFANGNEFGIGSDGIPDGFPNPYRLYKSGELIVAKRFSNFQFYGSYVLSKLYGNFEGSFRNDNGQQDPNISSLFDFTNSDGILTGQDIPGLLNTDRTHQFKLFSNYMWKGFTFGASWLPTSGTPITDLFIHPAYQNAGEIPVCPGSTLASPIYSCTGGPRGAEGRTPWTYDFNLHGEYSYKFHNEKMRVKFVADLFNVFNEQKLIHIDQWAQRSGGATNVDFLMAGTNQYRDPYEIPFNARLAVRFEF